MLMSFIDATQKETSFATGPGSAAKINQALQQTYNAIADEARKSTSTESLPPWETWQPNCQQALETLHSGWNATPCLRDIPPEHRHRFIIDADKLQAFENEAANAGLNVAGSPYAGLLFTEPGYLLGAASAHKVAFETPGRLDASVIDAVQSAIADANPAIKHGMQKGEQASIRPRSDFSDEAFSDMMLLRGELKARDGVSAFDLSPTNLYEGMWRTGSNPDTDADTKARIVNRWADDRDAALQKIGNEPSSAPLRAVALLDFLSKCNRLHPYSDGNGRLYQQVLLNRELHRAGLPLSILPKPGNLHLNGLSEMLLQLRDGMEAAAKYVPCACLPALQVLRDMKAEDAVQYVKQYHALFSWNANGTWAPSDDNDSDDDLVVDFTKLQ